MYGVERGWGKAKKLVGEALKKNAKFAAKEMGKEEFAKMKAELEKGAAYIEKMLAAKKGKATTQNKPTKVRKTRKTRKTRRTKKSKGSKRPTRRPVRKCGCKGGAHKPSCPHAKTSTPKKCGCPWMRHRSSCPYDKK